MTIQKRNYQLNEYSFMMLINSLFIFIFIFVELELNIIQHLPIYH